MIIKKISLFILFFLTIAFGYAQLMMKGKVIDHQNSAFLSNVHIINIQDSSVVVSNDLGEFELSKLGTYKFTRIGYQEKKIEIKTNKYIIVELDMKTSELNEVIVSAKQLPLTLKKSVATIALLSVKEIERANTINVNAVLNRVPGVFMQTGALNTNRITIRGIGSRNLFGTAKIRAYFEDIPLTTGTGETTIEDFELSSIGRFEIHKGATSSIYGAGLGGTIHLIPKKPTIDDTDISSEFTFGSYGLVKGLLNVNYGTTKNSFRAIYSNTHSDGYRDNNVYDRQTLTFTSNHFINEKNELSFISSYVDLKAFIPSSINEQDFLNNPASAAFTWGQAQGFEDAKRVVFGASWKHKYANNLKQYTSVFTSFRDGYEPRPFNVLAENTVAIGMRSRLLGKAQLFNKSAEWTVGGELFRDKHGSKTFQNLYRDFPAGAGSVQGDLLSNFKEDRSYFNLFFESNYHMSDKTMLSLGVNYNQTAYDLDDKFITTDNPDQSGRYRFDGVVSPKIGVSHLIAKNVSLYSAVSHGFSPPSISETLLPDGQINTDIQPETGWNFEIGTRGNLFENRLQFNAAIFRLDVRNLLVARRTAQDQFIGINAGKTLHDGLELAMNYHVIQLESISFNSYFSYTLNDFKFKEFIDEDENFSGNDLTGVPSHVFNAGIDFSTNVGFFGNINFQKVGSMPITDSNSLFTNSYNLTNLKVGYKYTLNKKIEMQAFLGLDNIFDEKYASQLLINASSFGGNAPRYYYPGVPLNYYTGINLKYRF